MEKEGGHKGGAVRAQGGQEVTRGTWGQLKTVFGGVWSLSVDNKIKTPHVICSALLVLCHLFLHIFLCTLFISSFNQYD